MHKEEKTRDRKRNKDPRGRSCLLRNSARDIARLPYLHICVPSKCFQLLTMENWLHLHMDCGVLGVPPPMLSARPSVRGGMHRPPPRPPQRCINDRSLSSGRLRLMMPQRRWTVKIATRSWSQELAAGRGRKRGSERSDEAAAHELSVVHLLVLHFVSGFQLARRLINKEAF